MRSFNNLKAGLALGALIASIPAQAAPDDFPSQAEDYLKSIYEADQPGVAVIVIDDGQVVLNSGYGLADVQAKRPITPQTVFRLGSITKQFTAAIILQLADEGKLSLNDPISKFLPDYPKAGGDATVEQLLNHTSGIKSYTGIPGWMVEENTARAFTTQQLIGEFKDQPADFAPGTEHRYNNSGYVLLGAIIEKLTGKPWHVAVVDRIAEPLGLTTIRYGELETQTPGMAIGYTERGGAVLPAQTVHMSVPHAAGALIGSVEDLAKWSEALHSGKVLSSARYQQMIAPTQLPGGKVENYGFGLEQGTLRGRELIRHGGGIFGFSTSAAYLPDEDLFVAVFANSDEIDVGPGLALSKLAAMALGDPFPEFTKADVPQSELEPLLGLYTFESGNRRFFQKDGKLFTRLSGGRDMEVFAAGDDKFFYGPETLSWFEITRDAAGKHLMSMYQGGSEKALTSLRTGPVPVDGPVVQLERSVLERFVGSYTAPQGMATVALTEDGLLTIQLGRGTPVPLLATSATAFRVDGGGAQVTFHSGSDEVDYLVFRQGEREIRADRKSADNGL